MENVALGEACKIVPESSVIVDIVVVYHTFCV